MWSKYKLLGLATQHATLQAGPTMKIQEELHSSHLFLNKADHSLKLANIISTLFTLDIGLKRIGLVPIYISFLVVHELEYLMNQEFDCWNKPDCVQLSIKKYIYKQVRQASADINENTTSKSDVFRSVIQKFTYVLYLLLLHN